MFSTLFCLMFVFPLLLLWISICMGYLFHREKPLNFRLNVTLGLRWLSWRERFIYIYMYMYMCIYMCVCVYVYMCVYTHTHTHTHTHIYIYVYICCCYCVFWPHSAACGILVPQTGFKPVPPALAVQSINHWTTREVTI